jgi:hypothetical protein
MSGEGVTLADQIQDAMLRALADERFDPIVRADIESISIELWIQTSAREISSSERDAIDAISLGLEGAEVEWSDAFAYYKPSVALTSGFTTSQELLSALCKKAGLFPDAWRLAACTVRRTTWVHLCEVGKAQFSELEGLRVKRNDRINRDAIEDLLNRSVSYLINNQKVDGTYFYSWNPLHNKTVCQHPNSVRASGCAYAMALAANSNELADRGSALKSALAANDAILKGTISWHDGLIVPERGAERFTWGKLGSTALLAASLVTPSMHERRPQETDNLFRSLLGAQRDDGSFRCFFGSNRIEHKAADFYPGEALLALVLRAEQGDMKCLASVELAFRSHRDYFRKQPNSAFIGWHADVWARASRLSSQRSAMISFVFEQLDWLAAFQIKQTSDRASGAFRPPHSSRPGVASVVYTEAIIRGLDLAAKSGNMDRCRRYRNVAIESLKFCLNLSLSKEQSIFFESPSRALGGMTSGLTDFEVRSDHVQHTITLALAALDAWELLTD